VLTIPPDAQGGAPIASPLTQPTVLIRYTLSGGS